MPATLGVLGAVTLTGVATAAGAWPPADPEVIEHAHADLHPGQSQLRDGMRHAHAFIIDDLHREWPAHAG